MDIKDSYLHGTVGVVKSISVSADKLTYNLADINNTAKTLTLPLATQSANGLLSKTDKKKIDSLGANASGNNFWEDTIPANEAMKLTLVGYVDFTLFIRNTLSKSLSVYHISGYGKIEGNTKRISIIQIYKNNTSCVIAPVDGEASIIIKNTSSNNILYTSAVIQKGSFTTSQVTSDISQDIITDSNIAASNTHIKNGVITINGTSITPLTQHQSLANYVTLNTVQTITESKTFSKLVTFSATPGILITRSSGVPYLRFGKDSNNVYGAIGTDDAGDACVYNDITGSGWSTLLHSRNYTNWVNTTNFPGLNKTGTVTSITVTGSNGLSGTGTITSSGTITLSNAGVRSIATGTTNGTISVNTNGTSANVAVKGLGSAAYTASSGYIRQINIGTITGPSDLYAKVDDYFGDNRIVMAQLKSEDGLWGHLLLKFQNPTQSTYGVDGAGLFMTGSTFYRWGFAGKDTEENPLQVTKYKIYDESNLSVVSNLANGLAPKVISSNTATVDSAYYVLASTNGSATPSWYKLPTNAFANDDTKVTQTNTTTSGDYRVLFSGNANDTTETTTARKSANLLFNPGTGKLTVGHLSTGGDIIFTGSNRDQYVYYYHNDVWAWRTGHQGTGTSDTNYFVIQNQVSGTVTTSLKIDYNAASKATFIGTVVAPTFQGNLDGTYVNALTGYKIATVRGAIAATDSLNTALGKLEYKAYLGETAYDWYKSVTGTDNDDIINKWEEIVDFIDSVKEGTDITDEFVTRKTNQTITGQKTFNKKLILDIEGNALSLRSSKQYCAIDFSITDASGNTIWSYLVQRGDAKFVIANSGWSKEYTILHEGNSHIKNGVITINGTSITPITQHQSLSDYVTLNTAQTITGQKNFNTNTNSVPLKISRSGRDSECLSIGVNDNTALFNLQQDETTANYKFTGTWSNASDGGDGTKAGTAYVEFALNADNKNIYLNNGTTTCTVLHSGNTYINSGTITINGNSITPLTQHQSLSNYVTLNTAQTITGLKTFESNSDTTGVSLILKNKAWVGGMATAMDFYNGGSYTVPNARIATLMNGSGKVGGTLIFYTQTKHGSTNPNPNGLTERFRIGDDGSTKITGSLTVTDSASFCASSTGKAAVKIGSNWITGNSDADILNSNGSWVILGNGVAKNGWTTYIDGNEVSLRYSTTHAVGMLLNSSGNVGIGTTTPTQKLHVSGNIYATGLMDGTRFNSRVATGTQPYACTSTTLNTNLNADLLDGHHKNAIEENQWNPTIDLNNIYATTQFTETSYNNAGSANITNLPFEGVATTIITTPGKYGFQIAHQYNSATAFKIRGFYNATFYAWKTLAFTDSSITGNASTASQVYINNSSNNKTYPVIFTNTGSCGTPRNDSLYVDSASGAGYNPSTDAFVASVMTAGVHNSTSTLYLDSAASTSIIIRPGGTEQARFLKDNGYLGLGVTSPSYRLHVSGTGYFTSGINVNSKVAIDSTGRLTPASSSTRNAGVYGVYDSTKVGHVWSMGTSYAISADGSSTGSMYGLVYFHTNWSNDSTKNDASKTEVSTYAGNHQIAHVINGKVYASLGSYVWSRNGFIKNGSSDSYVLLGGGGHKSISSFQTTYDDRYVLKAGDTMTGALTINASSNVGLTIKRTTAFPCLAMYGSSTPVIYGYYGFSGADNPAWCKSDGTTVLAFCHAGNSSVSGGGSTWGSSITVKINGTSKTLTLPSNPNTDSLVQQSKTTSGSMRPILMGYTQASAVADLETDVTNKSYVSSKIYAVPSTGTLYATTFSGNLAWANVTGKPTIPSFAALGSANKGVYLSGTNTFATMTYSLNATVEVGSTNKLAMYGTPNQICTYNGSVGDEFTPMYVSTGTLKPITGIRFNQYNHDRVNGGYSNYTSGTLTITNAMARANQIYIGYNGATFNLPAPSDEFVGLPLFFKNAYSGNIKVSGYITNCNNTIANGGSQTGTLTSNHSAFFICMKYGSNLTWVHFYCG